MKDGDLRSILRRGVPRAHWVTIETGLVTVGVPDSNCCLEGRETWVECKAARGWRVRIRPEQVAWMVKRTMAGGRALVAVRRQGANHDELWLLDGGRAREIMDHGLRGLPDGVVLLRTEGGPSRWRWDEVERLLRG